jgi:hypothetical protein
LRRPVFLRLRSVKAGFVKATASYRRHKRTLLSGFLSVATYDLPDCPTVADFTLWTFFHNNPVSVCQGTTSFRYHNIRERQENNILFQVTG